MDPEVQETFDRMVDDIWQFLITELEDFCEENFDEGVIDEQWSALEAATAEELVRRIHQTDVH